MNRLKLFILVFCLGISLPLAFLVYQSYSGLKQEERAQLLFFSETLFDQMERYLAEFVQAEEGRAVDEYQHFLAGSSAADKDVVRKSPLAEPIYPDFILGYLQNNLDGSFQTPLAADMGLVDEQNRDLVRQLREANELFNQKKVSIPAVSPEPAATMPEVAAQEKQKSGFAERYLKRAQPDTDSAYLRQEEPAGRRDLGRAGSERGPGP